MWARKIIGIYGILCIPENKIYIGKSSNVKQQISTYYHRMKINKHENILMQEAFNKFGRSCFRDFIIEECEYEDLGSRAAYWISYYKSNQEEFGYNKQSGEWIGYTVSRDAVQRAMNNNQKCLFKSGKDNPQYNKHGELNPNYGNKWTDEMKSSLSKKRRDGYKSGKYQPMRGYRHMYKDGVNKMVSPSDLKNYLNDGWSFGVYRG